MVKEEWINEQNRGRKEGKIWLKQDSQGPFLDHYWMSVRTVPEQAQPLKPCYCKKQRKQTKLKLYVLFERQ